MEDFGEVGIAVESAAQGNICNGKIGSRQQLLSCSNPMFDEIIHRGLVNGVPKTPQTFPGADGGGRSNLLKGQFLAKMFMNVRDLGLTVG